MITECSFLPPCIGKFFAKFDGVLQLCVQQATNAVISRSVQEVSLVATRVRTYCTSSCRSSKEMEILQKNCSEDSQPRLLQRNLFIEVTHARAKNIWLCWRGGRNKLINPIYCWYWQQF